MSGLLLSQWQVDHLAREWSVDEDEVLRRLGAFNFDAPINAGPCECSRIPWKPHRHRYTLGDPR